MYEVSRICTTNSATELPSYIIYGVGGQKFVLDVPKMDFLGQVEGNSVLCSLSGCMSGTCCGRMFYAFVKRGGMCSESFPHFFITCILKRLFNLTLVMFQSVLPPSNLGLNFLQTFIFVAGKVVL